MKQSLEGRIVAKIAELEHDVVSNNTIIQDAIERKDWETIARLASGMGHCARLAEALRASVTKAQADVK